MSDAKSDNLLVQVAIAQRLVRPGALGGMIGAAPKMPANRPGMTLLRVTEASGRRQLLADAGAKTTPDMALYIRTEPWRMKLTLTQARTDADGHAWDLVLGGTWTISAPAKFAEQFAMNRIMPDAPLDASDVHALVMAKFGRHMSDLIRDRSLEELRDNKKSFPASWWETWLNDWFSPLGLRAVVAGVEMSSASASAAEERRRQEEYEREVQAHRSALRDREITDRAAEADFEQCKAKIETDRKLADGERAAQLAELERRHQEIASAAEKVRLAAAQELERLKFSHEIEMAAIREKVVAERIQWQKEADQRLVESRRLAKLQQMAHIAKLKADRERMQADVDAGTYRAEGEKAGMRRKIAEMQAAETAAKHAEARQEIEQNLIVAEAKLRQEQLAAEHRQAATAAEALNAEKIAMLSRQEQATRDQEARLAEQCAAQFSAEHSAKMAQINSDRTLSEDARRLQIETENTRLATAKTEADAARARAKRDEALHDRIMEILNVTGKRAEAASTDRADAEQHVAKFHAGMATELPKISQTIAELMGSDPTKAHQAAEKITQQWHTPAPALQSLGYRVAAQTLVDRWTHKARSEGNPVRLNKQNMTTRDFGVSSAKSLRIGQTLQFSVTSARPGHVTVINLGTSGKFWLLCPGLCPLERSRVAPNRTYELPGPELFPVTNGVFFEKGPVGWEHLVAIVSDRPLFDASWLRSARDQFNLIAPAELEQIVGRLDQTPGGWSAGILSFLVE